METTQRPQMPRQGSKAKLLRTQSNLYRDQLVSIIREVTQIQKEKKKSDRQAEEAAAVEHFKEELELYKLQQQRQESTFKEPTELSESTVQQGEDEEEGSPLNSSDEFDTDLEIEGEEIV